MSKKIAADYFSRHTNNECHITSDGRVFHDAGSAQSFASGLTDQKITAFTRKEVEAPENDEEPRVLTLLDFEGFNETTDYAAAKALVKKLGLKASSQKQEDIFKVLNEELAKVVE